MKISCLIREGQKSLPLVLAGVIFAAMPTASAADLSLQEAIYMALRQNTGIKITQKGEDTAEAALQKTKGENGVSVSASDTLSTSKGSDSARSDSNRAGISASLPLYSGGKKQADIKSAELGVKLAALSTERDRENLKLSVIQAYYDALEANKTVAVRQETVDKYQEHYTTVSQLYSAGAKARIDVIRSSVELSDARQELIKAQNSCEVNLATLRNYLNMDRIEPLNLTTDFSYEAFGSDVDACIDYAYMHRKDLRIDQYRLAQKEQAVKSAKAGYLPSVKLNIGLDQSNVFHPSGSSSQSASASVGLSWNLFDGGATEAAIQSAKTDYDIARLNLLQDEENIDLSVRKAYCNMREAEKRFYSTKDAVHQAQEDAFIAREKYRVGEGLMLDIIDAQEALSKARLNFISAEYDYARYKAVVENEMGMGLDEGERQAAGQLNTDVDETLAASTVAQRASDRQDMVQTEAEAENTAKTLAGNEGMK